MANKALSMSDWIDFYGVTCPCDPNQIVQLKLSNGNTPINIAGNFHWEVTGRGSTYPIIQAYRFATEKEYNDYQGYVREFRLKKAMEAET